MSYGKVSFLTGILLGVAIALYSALIIYGYVWSFEAVRVWLSSWQTLISTTVAVLAAIAAVLAIGIQVQQTDDHKSQELRRKNLAARVAISQPLSNISEAQENILNELGNFITQQPKPASWNIPLIASNVDDKDLQALIRCLETSEGSATLDIAELISDIQIQSSRLRDLRTLPLGRIFTNSEITDRAVDALLIYARSGRLLNYARLREFRYQNDNLPTILNESCKILILRTEIEDQTERRVARFKDPWLCSKFEGQEE